MEDKQIVIVPDKILDDAMGKIDPNYYDLQIEKTLDELFPKHE